MSSGFNANHAEDEFPKFLRRWSSPSLRRGPGDATTGNTSMVTVTPSDGFTGSVNLTCAVTTAPTGATSPATCGVTNSVSIAGTTAVTATLAVTPTATCKHPLKNVEI